MAATTRNCCVLFADVAGSTRLYEQLGDAEALRAIERCLNRVERAIVACGGKVVKTIGDELMATFTNAELACHAAGVMHARIEGLPSVAGDKLAIRVGFHYGSVLVDGGDVFGNTVNVASRITEVAKAREIITSVETAQTLPENVRNSSLRPLPAITVKGMSKPLDLVEIMWKSGPTARISQSASNAVAPIAAVVAAAKEVAAEPRAKPGTRVILRYGKQEILMRGDAATVTMGRDQHNDIVIHDPRASRMHGVIELRQGQCMLIDKSSNGTFVSSKVSGNIAVHKEEIKLQGSGRICFGHLCPADSVGSLSYEVQTGVFDPNASTSNLRS
ncbi:MAG TPA: adenylate/guanylate cyclase domain-containing protein [Rhodocyclaceae bacterium]|jgi:class 3 adenylate cyclase|nr:adenylate/guanylate cyclase domain-containing protein [Rhodocyclaceae bacterium]